MQKKQKILIKEKINILKNIITNNINALERYKYLDLITSTNYHNCNIQYEKLFIELEYLDNNIENKNLLEILQKIINEISSLIMQNGSYSLTDLISITIGNSYLQKLLHDNYKEKFIIINKFLSPISYQIINWTKIKNEDSDDDLTYFENKNSNKTDNICIKDDNKTSKNQNIKITKNDKNINNDKKIINKNKIINDKMIINQADDLECFDLGRQTQNFMKKIYGINVILHDNANERTLIVSCLATNTNIYCINSNYIQNKLSDIIINKPDDKHFLTGNWDNYYKSLTLKDILIFNDQQIYDKFIGYIYQINLLKQNNINDIINEFVGTDSFNQRKTIILLLIDSDNNDFKYIANLLFDLLNNENPNYINNNEQTIIYNSLPYYCKIYFNHAIKETIKYTHQLSDFDKNKIPYEQQICLMKTNDYIKEKAMTKLKEIQSKSDESSSKAKQFLEGLLKIPFGTYIYEEIFNVKHEIQNVFKLFINYYKNNAELFKNYNIILDINKDCYSNNQILNIINYIYLKLNSEKSINYEFTNYDNLIVENDIDNNDDKYDLLIHIYNYIICKMKKEALVLYIKNINNLIPTNNINYRKIKHSHKSNDILKKNIYEFYDYLLINKLIYIIDGLIAEYNDTLDTQLLFQKKYLNNNINNNIAYDNLSVNSNDNNFNNNDNSEPKLKKSASTQSLASIASAASNNNLDCPQKNSLFNNSYIDTIQNYNTTINDYLLGVNKILDESIYGHKNAKLQIERIIGQWINGENKGYCFGFEGPPGTGKTSLAKKGIANCLINAKGESRPFAFIAIGGSSNSSILDGHNYTYMGSTWGKLVDILMEKKCMNPIIFIDEIDKVSKTEHGKEIIGILTHLVDSTQNDCFQDKYFSGVDLDLSKALFIFSYNDVEKIDKILLDRIHRIKFDHLTIHDKSVIVKQFLLPELTKQIGLENSIEIEDESIKFLVNNFTCESGVRKLKELLFEVVSQVNLDLLKNKDNELIDFPIIINVQKIKEIFRDKTFIRKIKINENAKVGIINGMWANNLGQGGILHIECKFFPTGTLLDLKLTGMQGDVMKESMNVAKSLCYSLLNQEEITNINKYFETTKNQGIHVHVPEGATPKDGPSAGTAITIAIYSLITNKKIKNNFAITGEINLQGNVTAIGGLELKFLGGLEAGVTNFIYPKDNNYDYKLFLEKYKDKICLEGINFYEVSHIRDVFKLIFSNY